MINNVILVGRTTKDIQLTKSKDGNTSIVSFQLAVNRRGKDAGTDFISCKAFNKTAELLTTVTKGSQIGLEGRIQTGSYEKNGGTVYTTDVMISQITFLEKKGTSDLQPTTQQPNYQKPTNQYADWNDSDTISLNDNDLPF